MRQLCLKAISIFAAGCATAILVPAPASALSVSFTSTVSVTDNINTPNIGYTSNGLNTTLTVGAPFVVSNFIVAGVNGSSFNVQTGNISAVFTFTVPAGANGGTDFGSIAAFTRPNRQPHRHYMVRPYNGHIQ